jgi:uncharacterized OB-fold protein
MSPDEKYASFLRQGRFMLQRCKVDGGHVFYPRVLCPRCGSTELEWAEVSGKGSVYSTTTVRRKPEEGGDYNIVLVDLDEGPRMLSRVEDVSPSNVRIGMPVVARIEGGDERPLLVFVPAEHEA